LKVIVFTGAVRTGEGDAAVDLSDRVVDIAFCPGLHIGGSLEVIEGDRLAEVVVVEDEGTFRGVAVGVRDSPAATTGRAVDGDVILSEGVEDGAPFRAAVLEVEVLRRQLHRHFLTVAGIDESDGFQYGIKGKVAGAGPDRDSSTAKQPVKQAARRPQQSKVFQFILEGVNECSGENRA